MGHRVAFLEKSFEKMDAKLDLLIGEVMRIKESMPELRADASRDISQLRADISKDFLGAREDMSYLKGRIEGTATVEALGQFVGHVKTLPSAESFGELRGRVDSLPTTAKLASLLGLAVAAIGIINNWPLVKSFIFGS